MFRLSFPGGSDILCSTNTVESILYSLVFALQSGVTLVSITFCLNRYIFSRQSPRVSLFPVFSSLFQSSTYCILVIGVLLHVLSLLSSSFVEEEHQTWYFFTSTLFVIIFLEKSLFRKGKNHKDSEIPGTVPRQTETSKDKKSKICSGEKVFNHSNEVRNANFHNDHSCSKSTGINVDGVLSKGEKAVKDLSQSVSAREKNGDEKLGNFHSRREITLQNYFLWHLLVVLVLLGLGRLSRGWNQTGIKWADRPDIGDWLVKPENRTALSICYLISLLVIVGFRYNRQNAVTSFIFVIGVANAYVYRTVTGSLQLPWIPNEPITKGIRAARFTYCCVVAMVMWNLFLLYKTSRNSEKRRLFQKYICEICGSLEGLLSGVLLLEILLQRPHNVIVLAIFVLQEHVLSKILWKR